MKLLTLTLILLLMPGVLLAQVPPAGQQPPAAPKPAAQTLPKPAAPAPSSTAAPAAAAVSDGASKVAIIDLNRAVVENVEGKKAAEKFMARMNEKQAELEKKQKAIQEMQNRLQTQDKALSDPAKADLARTIEKQTTELNRANEDAQKDLDEVRNVSLRPIAEKVNKILSAYAAENGFTVVFDVSNPQSGVIYANDVADITTEIIRRFDAEAAKAASPAGAKKPQ